MKASVGLCLVVTLLSVVNPGTLCAQEFVRFVERTRASVEGISEHDIYQNAALSLRLAGGFTPRDLERVSSRRTSELTRTIEDSILRTLESSFHWNRFLNEARQGSQPGNSERDSLRGSAIGNPERADHFSRMVMQQVEIVRRLETEYRATYNDRGVAIRDRLPDQVSPISRHADAALESQIRRLTSRLEELGSGSTGLRAVATADLTSALSEFFLAFNIRANLIDRTSAVPEYAAAGSWDTFAVSLEAVPSSARAAFLELATLPASLLATPRDVRLLFSPRFLIERSLALPNPARRPGEPAWELRVGRDFIERLADEF